MAVAAGEEVAEGGDGLACGGTAVPVGAGEGLPSAVAPGEGDAEGDGEAPGVDVGDAGGVAVPVSSGPASGSGT